MNAVRFEDVTRRFGDVTALDALSLQVERGELFGLLGPNGAGKSTTIGILTGQLLPDEGQVSVLGTDPTTDPVATRSKIGVLPERESPPSFLTAREYFALVGSVRELDPPVVENRVDEWAARLSFADRLDTLCTDLSRGQQQKVMVAAAFLHEPAMVVIDEPLSNLDPVAQEQVKRHLHSYVDEGGTVVLSTHHLEVAESLCTRAGLLDRGRLIEEWDPATVDGSLLDAFLAAVDRTTEAHPDAAIATEE